LLGRPHRGRSGTLPGFRSHIDNDDATLWCVSVFFWIFVLRRIWTAALVAQRNLESRTLMAPSLLFLAATDLFDDPRFEH
jgi:hypothetical protein